MASGNADVIVIGAGHNGLVAANYLADAGLAVLVLEAQSRAGGMAGSSCAIPGAPGHVMNHCAVDPIFWDLFRPSRDLELPRFGLRMLPVDPAGVYLDPDGSSLAFWADPRKTAAEIRRFSVDDADVYLDFVELLRGLSDFAAALSVINPGRPEARSLAAMAGPAWRHRARLADVAHLAIASAEEVVNERFLHPIVRNALHGIGGVTSPTHQAGTAGALITVPSFHRPCWRPVGGTQGIPDALVTRLRQKGGTVRTSASVAEIVIRGGRARSVLLTDGAELHATQAVLAACDPRTALERLLPAGTLPERVEQRVPLIPTNAAGYGHIKVDLALSGRLDLSRHETWRGDGVDLRNPSHIIATEAGLARAFGRAGAGLFPEPEDLTFWNAIPTAVDPSQAPPGQDTVYLYSPTAPARPEGGWAATAADSADIVVKRAAEFYGGLTELEIARHVQTNDTLAADLGVTGGQIAHVDWTPSRIGPLRPARGLAGFSTPVPGLYLGSAGCHPGGGVTGMPGYLAARTILRDQKRRSRPG